MIDKSNNDKMDALLFIPAIGCILSMNPYFLWPSFFNGYLRYIAYFIYLISIYYLLKHGNTKKRFALKKHDAIALLLLICVFAFIYLHSFGPFSISTIISGLLLFSFIFSIIQTESDTRIMVFGLFVKLLIISLIPGLFYYILEMFGISLSIETMRSSNQLIYQNSVEYALGSGDSGYYKVYIGAVMRVNTNTRFSGIYDESGLVGTITALCLIAKRFDFKRDNTCWWLLLFNIISFSLAGYLLIIAYFMLKWIRHGQWKLAVGVIVLLFAINAFMDMNITNPTLKNLQSRLTQAGSFVSFHNNRTTSRFQVGYEEFIKSGIFTKLFGFGRGADTANVYMNGSSSYKCYIYNYGYFGFLFMMLSLFYMVKDSFKNLNHNWDEIILICLFFLSIYQRPAVFYPYYFIILLGGKDWLRYIRKNGIAPEMLRRKTIRNFSYLQKKEAM